MEMQLHFKTHETILNIDVLGEILAIGTSSKMNLNYFSSPQDSVREVLFLDHVIYREIEASLSINMT